LVEVIEVVDPNTDNKFYSGSKWSFSPCATSRIKGRYTRLSRLLWSQQIQRLIISWLRPCPFLNFKLHSLHDAANASYWTGPIKTMKRGISEIFQLQRIDKMKIYGNVSTQW